MDGSFHDWFEKRGPRGCLMNIGDDASGDTLARMGSEETIWAAVGVLRAWVEKYGIPVALLYGLEECVCTRGEFERAIARGRRYAPAKGKVTVCEKSRKPRGIPLSHSLGDYGRLTKIGSVHRLREGVTSNVVSMGTFLMSVDTTAFSP